MITACLMHDLGNIVKMDFSLHDEGYGQPIAYREEKKAIVKARYGTSCHEATIAMCRELGVAERVIAIIDHMGIKSFMEEDGPRETQIVRYTDMRVDPRGVVSLDERMLDGYRRYKDYPSADRAREPLWTQVLDNAHQQELRLFTQTNLLPEQITQQTTLPYQAALWSFQIVLCP